MHNNYEHINTDLDSHTQSEKVTNSTHKQDCADKWPRGMATLAASMQTNVCETTLRALVKPLLLLSVRRFLLRRFASCIVDNRYNGALKQWADETRSLLVAVWPFYCCALIACAILCLFESEMNLGVERLHQVIGQLTQNLERRRVLRCHSRVLHMCRPSATKCFHVWVRANEWWVV